MKYAIVKSGSSQLKVLEGTKIKLLGNLKSPKFEVLFFNDGSKSVLDKAQLKGVKISAELVKQARGRKLVVGRYKAKSRYDKQRGFRATYTEFLISKIDFAKAEKSEQPKAEVSEQKEEKTTKRTTKKLASKE